MYDYPTTINGSDIGSFFSYLNNVTESWISNSLLISLFVIVLITYYRVKNDFWAGMGVAGFSTFIVSVIFWIAGFISGITLGISIAIMAVSVIALLLNWGD